MNTNLTVNKDMIKDGGLSVNHDYSYLYANLTKEALEFLTSLIDAREVENFDFSSNHITRQYPDSADSQTEFLGQLTTDLEFESDEKEVLFDNFICDLLNLINISPEDQKEFDEKGIRL